MEEREAGRGVDEGVESVGVEGGEEGEDLFFGGCGGERNESFEYFMQKDFMNIVKGVGGGGIIRRMVGVREDNIASFR